MIETRLDLQELDQILKKNTSELPNPLQGVSFSVFNNKGSSCICSIIRPNMLLHVPETRSDTDIAYSPQVKRFIPRLMEAEYWTLRASLFQQTLRYGHHLSQSSLLRWLV